MRNIAKKFYIKQSLIDITTVQTRYKCFYGEDVELYISVVDEFDKPVDLTDTILKLYYQCDKSEDLRQDDNITIDTPGKGSVRVLVKKGYIRVGLNTVRVVIYDEDQEVYLQPIQIVCLDTGIKSEGGDIIVDDNMNVKDEFGKTNGKVTALDGKVNGITSRVTSLEGSVTNVDGRLSSVEREIPEITASLETIAKNAINEKTTPIVALHRGCTQTAPENTIPSILECVKYGIEWVEIDVRFTSDNYPVLHHDETVDRMTNGVGAISVKTLADVKNLTIDVGNNIGKYPNLKNPTLSEALKEIKKNKLNVVIHVYPSVENQDLQALKVVESVKENGLVCNCIINSFSTSYIQEVRKIEKNITCGYIKSGTITDDDLLVCENIGNCCIAISGDNVVTDDNVKKAHSKNILVISDSVYNYANLIRERNKNIDFILSDIVGGI